MAERCAHANESNDIQDTVDSRRRPFRVSLLLMPTRLRSDRTPQVLYQNAVLAQVGVLPVC